jgi:hypothetical protein
LMVRQIDIRGSNCGVFRNAFLYIQRLFLEPQKG